MEIEAARRVRWSFKGDFLNFEDAVYFPIRILDRGATQDSKSSIGVTPSSRLLLKSSYVYFVWVSVSVTRFPYNIPNYYTWFNIAIKTLTRNFHFLCYCTCMQMHFLQRDILDILPKISSFFRKSWRKPLMAHTKTQSGIQKCKHYGYLYTWKNRIATSTRL